MKKILFLSIVVIITTITFAEEAKRYGSEITLSEKTAISAIIADAENFLGKKVLIEGTVVDVCAKRGCWINISGDKDYESIRVKVNDGEIVFPMEAKGKNALVEGEVYSVIVQGESCSGDCQSKNKNEKKEACEKSKNSKKVYMIKGLGAIIK